MGGKEVPPLLYVREIR